MSAATAYITLATGGCGDIAIVDAEDFERLRRRKWFLHRKGYAGNSSVGYMHRYILGCEKGVEVDHVNGDKRDNRKENLRTCTRSENMANQIKQPGKTSRFKGVYWHKARKKWVTQLKHLGVHIYLGIFRHEKDAAIAYNQAAEKYFGAFARLNEL